MPPQHGPDTAARWPVLSGPVPPLTAFYSPRPETGFPVASGAPEGLAARARAPETGSYVLAGPGGTGKTQLAAACAQSLWQSRDIELLVWISASSRAAILAGYADAYARTVQAPGGPAPVSGPVPAAPVPVAYSPGPPSPGRHSPGPPSPVAPSPVAHSPGPHSPGVSALNGPAPAGSGSPPGERPAGPAAAGDAGQHGYPAGGDQEQEARQFLRWLAESTRSWLIVLDDLADAGDVTGLWPRGVMGTTVLTTRLPPASIAPPGLHARLVHVGAFSRREALAFLTARLFEDTAQRNGALDLAQALGCLPIALSQAAALVADARIDCREYQARFAGRQQALGIGPDSGHAATVAVTWSLALDRTDQLLPVALARPLLAMLSMLDPGGVPAAVLMSAAAREYTGSYSLDRAPATEAAVRAVLTCLAQVGLVSIDLASPVRTVFMHELVQACVRQVLPPAVRALAATAAAGAVLQSWPEHPGDPYLDQALRDSAAALSRAGGEVIRTADAGRRLLTRAGRSLDEARLTGPAIAYWRAMIEAGSRARDLADGDAGLAAAAAMHGYMDHLAAAYQVAGRTDLAISVLGDSLRQREEALGPGHPDTLTARSYLARTCLAADRTQEALPHFERTLAGREWVLGPDHPETLAARSDLAGAYRAAGRLADSITVYRRTLADQELILGEDHPVTAATRGSLAAALHSAGRTEDAVPLFVKTLADRERVLGPDNPDTLTARGNLAYAYRSVGRLRDAIPLYAQTVAGREKVQGRDHPDTLTSRANLAAAYYDARKLKEAVSLYEQTLADRERVQGRDHPDTLTARGNLASAYMSAGRKVAALGLYERTLADAERVLGPHHESTLTSRANLAIAYHESRRTPDAIALFQRTLSDCEVALPPGHPLTRGVRESLEAARRT
jgi:tetratricopeptide (TPR) repeat protein